MNVHVHAYNHELMEGVPHPWIFKGKCTVLILKGGGTWNIDLHNDGRQMPKGPVICSESTEDIAHSIVLEKYWAVILYFYLCTTYCFCTNGIAH